MLKCTFSDEVDSAKGNSEPSNIGVFVIGFEYFFQEVSTTLTDKTETDINIMVHYLSKFKENIIL